MPKRVWIALLSFWPGVPQIWAGQEVLGLILAILFAATVNLAVVSRFIWTELFHPSWSIFFAAMAAGAVVLGLGLHAMVGLAVPP